MHWKNNSTSWPPAQAGRVSWRLVEGLEALSETLEKKGGGTIDKIRLRRPPVGNQAKHSTSRYLTWDTLLGLDGRHAAEIAAEITAAAEHLCREENCGEAFEAQIEFSFGERQSSRSISFSLGDGAPGENDDDGDDGDDDVGDDDDLSKLIGGPIGAMARYHTRTLELFLARADAASRREQSRVDQLMAMLLGQLKHERGIVEQYVKLYQPLVSHAEQLFERAIEVLTAHADAQREAKEIELEQKFKAQRLETLRDGLGALKQPAMVALLLTAKRLGIDPIELLGAVEEEEQEEETPARPPPPRGGDKTETKMSATEKAEQTKMLGAELRASLTDGQLDEIEKIDARIGETLRAITSESPAPDVVAAIEAITRVLFDDQLKMLTLLGKLDDNQKQLILRLLRVVKE